MLSKKKKKETKHYTRACATGRDTVLLRTGIPELQQ